MAAGEVDKDYLYGKFEKGEERRQRLGLRLAHKALDIADDDMDIQTNRTTNGISTGGMLGLGAITSIPSLGALGLLAYSLFNDNKPPAEPTPAPPAATSTVEKHVDERYLIFRDRHGNLIDVPRWSGALPEKLQASQPANTKGGDAPLWKP